MKALMTGGAMAALVGTLCVMSPLPAAAQLARPQTAASIGGDNNLLTDVQWRRGGHGWHGGYRGGYRGYYGPRRSYGPAIGLGFGLATGALIGGAFAAPYYAAPNYYYAPAPRVYYDDAPMVYRGSAGGSATAYCMQRFRSYDPSSGTYLGYDGQRHPCP